MELSVEPVLFNLSTELALPLHGPLEERSPCFWSYLIKLSLRYKYKSLEDFGCWRPPKNFHNPVFEGIESMLRSNDWCKGSHS